MNIFQFQCEVLESQLKQARRTQRNDFWMMIAFAVMTMLVTILLSSANGEYIATINKQSAVINQLTVERNILLQVQAVCAGEDEESGDETTLENANNL